MANPYEQAARDKKVTRLVDALDAHLGRLATRADLVDLMCQPVQISKVLSAAKVEHASAKTVEMLVARIEARDAKSRPGHKHLCLDCGAVTAEGDFDCEIDADHDFELCEKCAKVAHV